MDRTGPADEIGAQIDAVLASRSLRLRFPPALAAQHEADTKADRERNVILCATFGLIIYDLFIIADFDLIPDAIRASIVARFLVVTPLSLILILVMRRKPSAFVRETFQCVMSVMCVATILVLMVVSEAPLRIYQHYGVGLVLLYPAVAQRVYFRHLVPTLLVCAAMFVAALTMVPEIPPAARQSAVMILLGTVAFILIGAYNLERQTRLSYVLGLQMRRANRSLDIQAKTDPLTGLVNRLGFDERFATAWRSAQGSGRPVGVVMIDIDRFKLFNDGYGHPAGDRCLREVAGCVRGALRGDHDFAVRYGGEEMLCVLDGADLGESLRVAERIRAAIEALAIAHERSPPAGVVTASLGVASAIPHPLVTPAELVDSADAALYAAKRGGRNRVRPRSGAGPVRDEAEAA